MTSIAWTLRPATADDRDFVVEVTRAAMGPYLEATFGWDEAAQTAYVEGSFDASGGQVIEVDGIDVGELLVDERPGELVLVRVALLPDWQGRGIGSAVVRMLVDRARELRSVLVLQVFKTNSRAARLYESLGFIRVDENDTSVSMRLDPDVPSAEGIRVVSRVNESEVIASFLGAEFESERWRKTIQALLDTDGRSASVITEPDWEDADENAYRASLLELHRAWLSRQGLFDGFPDDVEWFRAALTAERVLSVLYIDWDWWLRISGGTRVPLDAARRIRNGEIPGSTEEWHEPIAHMLGTADPPPELIVVSLPDLSKLVLVEGHVRLTAYALFPEYLPDSLEVYLGLSDEIEGWSEF